MPDHRPKPHPAGPELGRARQAVLLLAVTVVTCSMLAFEVLQAITLSLQIFDQNAFLVIAVSLLGLGIGGSIAIPLRHLRPMLDPLGGMAWCAIGFGLSILACMVPASRSSDLVALMLLTAVPYVFVGLLLSILFASWPRRATTAYFADLLGSALGCFALLILITWTGDAAMVVLCIAFGGFLAGFLISLARDRSRLSGALALALAAGALVALPRAGSLYQFRASPGKQFAWVRAHPEIDTSLIWSKWGLLGRLDVLDVGPRIDHLKHHLQEKIDKGIGVRLLYASGDNNTVALDLDGNEPARSDFIEGASEALPYPALPPNPDVLNIGLGGGIDLFLALVSGARTVVGVEINPLMIEAMAELSPDFWGNDPFHHPRVTIYELDGRTYVNTTSRRFDLITLTAVDTGAGLATGAHVLSENYLYTQEAFDRYFEIMRPGGIIYVRRPRIQLLRILATASSSLKRRGATEPADHFIILTGRPQESFDFESALIFRNTISPEQEEAVRARIRSGGNEERLVWSRNPTVRSIPSDYRYFFQEGRTVSEIGAPILVQGRRVVIHPVTDDRPFFYHNEAQFLPSHAGIRLLLALMVAGGAAAAFILAPLSIVPLRESRSVVFWSLLYFTAIGTAFMFVEIALIQKLGLFLGHPAYSLVVALFGVLLFSGLGSMTAGRLAASNRSPLGWVFPIIAGIVAIYGLSLTPLLMGMRLATLTARVILSLAVIAPVSFLMGMPFPLKLRQLSGARATFVPWAWAVNAFFSVIGSILATIIAFNIGYGAVLEMGAAAYLLAMIANIRSPSAHGEEEGLKGRVFIQRPRFL